MPAASQTAETLVVLLSGVAQKDRAAFATLYQATSLKLFGIVLRILRRRALSEDILQEVYIKIWERAADFNPTRGSPITWMATIARNRAIDEVRRDRQLVSSEDVPGFEDIAEIAPNALDSLQQGDEYKKLVTCLGGIEEEKRSMVLLAYHHGLSREILAQKYGQPVSTIKTWLRRCLQSLKVCLES